MMQFSSVTLQEDTALKNDDTAEGRNTGVAGTGGRGGKFNFFCCCPFAGGQDDEDVFCWLW